MLSSDTSKLGLVRAPRTGAAGSFTLIELLVVIGIMAILLGMVFPIYLLQKEKSWHQKAVITAKMLALAYDQYYINNNKWPGDDGPVKGPLLAALTDGDAQGVAYFSIGTNTVDTFFDPWGNYYQVKFDHDLNNKVTAPDGVSEIYANVIVWSVATGYFGTVITNNSWA